jgi:hypothetical protein
MILNSPSGKTYVTTPSSALLFPSLCAPTGDLQAPQPSTAIEYCGERTAMMPQRRRTRQQDRTTARTGSISYPGSAPPGADDDPPPF